MSTPPPATARQVAAAGALAPHAAGAGRPLPSLTDEEIIALVDEDALAGFDLPWVDGRESRPTGFSRAEARLSAARSLLARGVLAPESAVAQAEGRRVEGDPSAYVPDALLTGILARRVLSPLVVRIEGPLQDRVTIVVMFVDHDGSVLVEQVSPDGLHHFAMCDREHAARLLVGRLLPPDVPAVDPASAVGTWDELLADPQVGPVLEDARRRSRVQVLDRRDGARDRLLVLAGPRGLALVEGDEERSDPASDTPLRAALADPAGIEDLAASLVRIDALSPEDRDAAAD